MGRAYAETIDALCPYRDYETCRRREDERVLACMAEGERLLEMYGSGEEARGGEDGGDDMDALFARWIEESHGVAERAVYVGVVENATASDAYVETVQRTSKELAVVAGRRLALVLTSALEARASYGGSQAAAADAAAGGSESGGGGGVGAAAFAITVLLAALVSLAIGHIIGTRRERARRSKMFGDVAGGAIEFT